MNGKQEFELARLRLWAHIIGRVLELIKVLATLACIVVCTYIMFEGLKSIVMAQPDAIKALAEFIKNLKVDSLLHFLVILGLGTWGTLERRGKKRLVRKLAVQRRALEAGDAYKQTSGLTDSGDTPQSMEAS